MKVLLVVLLMFLSFTQLEQFQGADSSLDPKFGVSSRSIQKSVTIRVAFRYMSLQSR